MKIILNLLIIFLINLNAELLEYNIKPTSFKVDTSMKIKILDTKQINFQKKNNIAFTEISDLAYKNKKLYAVGDKGYLYTLEIEISNDKISNLKLLSATKLKDKYGEKLKKKYRDSEGLVFVKDKLAISFEGKNRVDLYDFNGVKIKKLAIAKDLKHKKYYQGKNKGLESVAYNEKYGIVTAPERPLHDKKIHAVYSQYKTWKFKAEGSITGLEFRSKNKLLVLLRDFNHFTRQRIITIIELNLKKSSSKVLVKMDSADGWNVDNFEGITKLGKNKFLIISDDNDSIFQKTLLMLFEIID